MPDRVSVIATDIDPSTQGLGSLSLMNSSPPMQVNATSAASPPMHHARPRHGRIQPRHAPPLKDEGHRHHHQQHAHAVRRGHAIDARAVALCQVRHFAGATDRRREPGRLEIRVRISAQNRRTNEGQSQREQHARDDRPRVVADMLDDLRCEVQAQRCANDPLPGIARRPWTGCAQARDARGRRDQQRAQHPWQGHVGPYRHQRSGQRKHQACRYPPPHFAALHPVHAYAHRKTRL